MQFIKNVYIMFMFDGIFFFRNMWKKLRILIGFFFHLRNVTQFIDFCYFYPLH
jgi:hypothetical protein